MAKITFIEPNGARKTYEGDTGVSVMEVATRNGVAGILAECGGACACATCHVYVEPEWRDLVGEAKGDEAEMLDFAAEHGPGSRLSCQVRIKPEFDGLVVRVPQRQ